MLKIVLTKRLPAGSHTADPTHFPPWTVQLATGKWCSEITGATSVIGGLRVSYACTGGGLLLGNPRRTTPAWSIFYAPNYKSRLFTGVSIRSAWW